MSVGEILQLRQIVSRLQNARPDLDLLVTTTTETGYAVAKEKLAGCEIAYFPLDFRRTVQRALERVQPDLIILVELELWPNFMLEVGRQQIPLMLINGRLSARSFGGYRWIRPLVSRLLSGVKSLAVQSEEYRDRFVALGANPDCVHVTGSIKFDGVEGDRENRRTQELREWLRVTPEQIVFVAGSTQEPEEAYAVDAYLNLRQKFSGLRLILVPRHPDRADDVLALLKSRQLPVAQRSLAGISLPAAADPVGLLDTVGELEACWGLADIAFVGGSFTNRGGQNMIEPAAYGAAVCYGPNTSNFRQIVEMLEQRHASERVHSKLELEEFVLRMLMDRRGANEMGVRARELVRQQQGATTQTVDLILDSVQSLSRPKSSAA